MCCFGDLAGSWLWKTLRCTIAFYMCYHSDFYKAKQAFRAVNSHFRSYLCCIPKISISVLSFLLYARHLKVSSLIFSMLIQMYAVQFSSVCSMCIFLLSVDFQFYSTMVWKRLSIILTILYLLRFALCLLVWHIFEAVSWALQKKILYWIVYECQWSWVDLWYRYR